MLCCLQRACSCPRAEVSSCRGWNTSPGVRGCQGWRLISSSLGGAGESWGRAGCSWLIVLCLWVLLW